MNYFSWKGMCIIKLSCFPVICSLAPLNHRLLSCLYVVGLPSLWEVESVRALCKADTHCLSQLHSIGLTCLAAFCLCHLVALKVMLYRELFPILPSTPRVRASARMCLICCMRRPSLTAPSRNQLSHMVCINVTLNTHDKTKCS